MKSGLKIRELREKKGLKIFQLADEMGVSRQSITNWEESDPFPKGELFKKLCEFFEIDEEFFEVISEADKKESELLEELKSTIEFMKEQFCIINKEKTELMILLKLALQKGSGPFPMDNGLLSEEIIYEEIQRLNSDTVIQEKAA